MFKIKEDEGGSEVSLIITIWVNEHVQSPEQEGTNKLFDRKGKENKSSTETRARW